MTCYLPSTSSKRAVRSGAAIVLAVLVTLAATGCGDDAGSAAGSVIGTSGDDPCDLLTEEDLATIGTVADIETSEGGTTCTFTLDPVGSVLVTLFDGALAEQAVYEEMLASDDYEAVEGLGADVAEFHTGKLVAFTDGIRMELTAFGVDREDERALFETALDRLVAR